MAYRLLYEEGLAVSKSFLNPQRWEKVDLIFAVEPAFGRLALLSPQSFYIRLDDEQSGLAPELEQVLRASGLNPQLHTLAPILESCLLTQAGKIDQHGEVEYSDKKLLGELHQEMFEAGMHLRLWDPFLDKGV